MGRNLSFPFGISFDSCGVAPAICTRQLPSELTLLIID
jgi:hypothetical protein